MIKEDVLKNVLKNKTMNELVKEQKLVKPETETDTTKIEQAITMLKDIEKNNGYTAIAQILSVPREDVVRIHEEMQKKIIELTPKTIQENPFSEG